MSVSNFIDAKKQSNNYYEVALLFQLYGLKM